MTDMYIRLANNIETGYAKAECEYSMSQFHYHDGYEIYYLKSGKRGYIIGDEYVSLSAGDVVLVKPGVLHKTVGGVHERYLLCFTESIAEKYLTEEMQRVIFACFNKKLVNTSAHRAKFIELFEKIKEYKEKGKEEFAFIYITELLVILAECVKNDSEKSIITTKDNVNSKILHFINKNYSEINNINQIAEEFYITKYYLCRIFKKATGVSVIEYLNRVKVKNACDKLAITKKTVTEIGMECGFNSSEYFCKLFKIYMQMTPSEYRKKVR